MEQRQRTAIQRALAHEALGKLRAISEWFGTESHELVRDASEGDLARWQAKIDDLERWIWDESPIA